MTRRETLALASVVSTAVFEIVTLLCRLATGVSAAEFNRSAPLILQIHHMFWSLPLFAVAWFARARPMAPWLTGTGIGLVASDLLHHFVVLPLLVGNTGWHWP